MAAKYPDEHHFELRSESLEFEKLELTEDSSFPELCAAHINELPVGIFHKLFSFLQNWEVVSIRRVSSHWNSAVKSYSRFLEKAYVLVSSARGLSPEETYQNLETFDPVWKRVRIQRTRDFPILLPSNFTDNLLHIELIGCTPTISWETLLSLLCSTPRLEELILRKSLKSINTSIREPNDSIFDTLCSFSKNIGQFPDLKAIEFRVKEPLDALLMMNLISARSTGLRRVSYGCRTPQNGIGGSTELTETVGELNKALNRMLHKHAGTLELFHSYLMDPVRPREAQDPSFESLLDSFCTAVIGNLNRGLVPLNLKSFCLYGGALKRNVEPMADLLKTFLASQTNLEKVILPRIRFETEAEFFSFVESIPRMVKVVRVPTYFRLPESLFSEFKALNEFYIETHGCSDLQTVLPARQSLPEVRTVSFYNCGTWICREVRMLRIITAFPALTELLIRDDGECFHVEDSDLQNICRYLPGIRKIYISSCDCVSDFGVSGIAEDEVKRLNENVGDFVPAPGTRIGYPFSALTSLQYLSLLDLGFKLTDVGLAFGISCPNLRVMMLEGYPNKVTVLGVSRLASNNPNLKHWQLNFHDSGITDFVTRLQEAESQDSISIPLAGEDHQHEDRHQED